MNPKRIIIAGGRDFNDRKLVEATFSNYADKRLLENEEVTIVSGGAKGADTLGEELARKLKTNLCIYPAQWAKYGKVAGYNRNKLMAQNADVLLAFWNGDIVGSGTKHMIDLANKEGLDIIIIDY